MNKEHNRIFTMANVAFCIAEKVSRFFFVCYFYWHVALFKG